MTTEIQTQITRLDNAKADIAEAIENKGVTVESGTKLDGMATLINEIATSDPATEKPLMDGTASVGTSTKYAREDHRHPTDTGRQAKITASGILKGNGSGTISAATAGTDYALPSAIPNASSATPAMNGTAKAGSSSDYARADHVHPSDTAKANKSEVFTLTNYTTPASGTNFNSFSVGNYRIASYSDLNNMTNHPPATSGGILKVGIMQTSSYRYQLFLGRTSSNIPEIYIRVSSSGTFGDWKKITLA